MTHELQVDPFHLVTHVTDGVRTYTVTDTTNPQTEPLVISNESMIDINYTRLLYMLHVSIDYLRQYLHAQKQQHVPATFTVLGKTYANTDVYQFLTTTPHPNPAIAHIMPLTNLPAHDGESFTVSSLGRITIQKEGYTNIVFATPDINQIVKACIYEKLRIEQEIKQCVHVFA